MESVFQTLAVPVTWLDHAHSKTETLRCSADYFENLLHLPQKKLIFGLCSEDWIKHVYLTIYERPLTT